MGFWYTPTSKSRSDRQYHTHMMLLKILFTWDLVDTDLVLEIAMNYIPTERI